MSLDLEKGDYERAEQIAKEGQERSKRVRSSRGGDSSGGGSSSKSSGSKTASQRTDTDLVSRLDSAFSRLAEQLAAREDHELAEAIVQDKEAMSKGLVSLTRGVKFLRTPLVVVLNFLEPVLAFWHVGGILLGRFIERRQRVMAERQQAAAGAQVEDYVVPVS